MSNKSINVIKSYLESYKNNKVLCGFYDLLTSTNNSNTTHFRNMYPISAGYISANLPVNLFHFRGTDLLTKLPYFTVRDGPATASLFFQEQKRPLKENQFYFVTPDVYAIAPVPWREQMLLYRKTSGIFKTYRSLEKQKSLFLYINASVDFLPLADRFKLLSAFIEKEKFRKICVIMDNTDFLYRPNADKSAYSFTLFHKFFNILKDIELNVITPDIFLKDQDIKGASFIDFNDGNVVYGDNYLTFHSYKQGADVCKLYDDFGDLFGKVITDFPISPYHSISLHLPSMIAQKMPSIFNSLKRPLIEEGDLDLVNLREKLKDILY